MTRAHGVERLLPGMAVARRYQRSWLKDDIVAGAVLTALLIPAGMGYAEAAGLPVETGLYATIVPLLAYALFGPSRILVLGPDSALAPIIAASVLPLAAGDPDRAVALAGLLALLMGGILLVGGVLRLGFVTDLLSKPIRVGYLNGIALVVVVGQIPKLLGYSIDDDGSLLADAWNVLRGIADGDVDTTATWVGLGSLAVIVGFKRFIPKIPGVLVAVVGAMVLTAVLGLDDEIPVVGALPEGLPAPALGGLQWSDVLDLIGPAAGIALIAFADTGVLSRTFAARRGETVDGSHEMAGIGLANLAGGAFGGFPVSASSSRTPVAEAAGSKSQLTGVVGALLIVVFIVVAPNLTDVLPSATLAAVVIVAATSLVDLKAFVRLYRMSKTEMVLSVSAFLGVALVGVLQGIVIAVALSFVAFIEKAWRPHRTELVRVDGMKGYHDVERHPEGRRIPGLLIVRWDAPLFFANGGIFDDSVRSMVEEAEHDGDGDGEPDRAEPIRWVVLAAEPITGLDTTAVDEVAELDDYLQRHDVHLVFAELKDPIRERLVRYGLGERFDDDHFFPTLGTAVKAYVRQTGTSWTDWEDREERDRDEEPTPEG
jgi:high affinity sulfate transporter 1